MSIGTIFLRLSLWKAILQAKKHVYTVAIAKLD